MRRAGAALVAALALATAASMAAASASPNPRAIPPADVTLAFGGSGTLMVYYAGVLHALEEAGVAGPATRYAGMSGGALASALAALGISGERMKTIYKDTPCVCDGVKWDTVNAADPVELRLALARCASSLSPPEAALKTQLAKYITPATVGTVSDRVQVWASQLDPLATARNGSVATPLAPFADPADAADALVASSYIPCLIGPWKYTAFRGRPFIDGGYSASWDQLCINATTCVRVASNVFGPQGQRPRGDDVPHLLLTLHNCPNESEWVRPGGVPPNPVHGWGPDFPLAPQSKWRLPKACPPPAMLTSTPPATLVTKLGLPSLAPLAAKLGPRDPPPPGVLRPGPPDINPGHRVPLPFNACKWLLFGVFKPWKAEDVDAIYQHGVDTARAWAAEQGYAA